MLFVWARRGRGHFVRSPGPSWPPPVPGKIDPGVAGKTSPSCRVPGRAVKAPAHSLELTALYLEAGLTWNGLQTFLGRSERTLRRWRHSGPPRWVRELLRLRAGYLDARGWKGWRLVDGEIYAPDLAHGFRQSDLYRAHWDRQRVRALESVGSDVDVAYHEYQDLPIFKRSAS